MTITEEEKVKYTYWFMEALAGTSSPTIADKMWSELVIKGVKTFDYVPTSYQFCTALKLIELGHRDLVSQEFLDENGL